MYLTEVCTPIYVPQEYALKCTYIFILVSFLFYFQLTDFLPLKENPLPTPCMDLTEFPPKVMSRIVLKH